MDLFKISVRVAAGFTASLTPLTDLQQIAEGMLEDVDDPDMKDLLNEIIESCKMKDSKAYLLMEDLAEIENELSAEGHGVPHTQFDISLYDERAASVKLF